MEKRDSLLLWLERISSTLQRNSTRFHGDSLTERRDTLSPWLERVSTTIQRGYTWLQPDELTTTVGEDVDFLSALRADQATMQACSILWANVKLQSRAERLTTLLLAGTQSSSSTAPLVLGLALAVADAQRGEVLVVDADLRAPYLHRLLDVPQAPGLGEVLKDQASLDESIHELVPRVYLLPAGTASENLMLLFEEQRLEQISAQITQRFETTLFTAPGLLAHPDGHLLAGVVKRAVLLVNVEEDTEAELQRCKRALEVAGTEILGTALVEGTAGPPLGINAVWVRTRLLPTLGALAAVLLLLILVWNLGSGMVRRLTSERRSAQALAANQDPPRMPTDASMPAPTQVAPAVSVVTATTEPTNTPLPTATATVPAAPGPTSTLTVEPTEVQTTTNAPTPQPGGVVTANILNLRSGPGTAHPVIGKLQQGAILNVIARTSDGEWLQVTASGGGTSGWVAGAFVALDTDLQSIPIAAVIPTPPGLALVPTSITVTSPTPQPATYSEPKLRWPPHQHGTDQPDEVVLRWEWPQPNQCGPLAPDEYFDVRVWTDGQPHSGIAWTKACEYSLKGFLTSKPAQTFQWVVAVIRGQDGKWEADLSSESEAWSLSWRPPN